MERSYKGWFHLIDDKAPRFTFNNGVYQHVPFYTYQAATIGNSAVVNPDYDNAPFELVIPFLPTVLTRLIPKSVSTMGSGTTFQPWNYAGTPYWQNNFDRTYNPYGKVGYFSVLMQAGWLPELIENGWAIMCARPCAAEMEMVSCVNPQYPLVGV